MPAGYACAPDSRKGMGHAPGLLFHASGCLSSGHTFSACLIRARSRTPLPRSQSQRLLPAKDRVLRVSTNAEPTAWAKLSQASAVPVAIALPPTLRIHGRRDSVACRKPLMGLSLSALSKLMWRVRPQEGRLVEVHHCDCRCLHTCAEPKR